MHKENEAEFKKINGNVDRLKYLMEQIERAHQIDQDKIQRIHVAEEALETEFENHKKIFYEQFEMQGADYEHQLHI